MKITKIQASAHRIPIRLPLIEKLSHGAITVTRIETDNGLVGYGFNNGSSPFAVKEYVNRELGPALLGQDPLNTERLWHQLFWRFNQRARTGAVSDACSTLDIALWDIKGKALGLPIYQLLGGAQSEVPVYATYGMPQYSIDQLVEAGLMRIRQGHTRLKMVVAHHSPAEDAKRAAAVREAVGDSVELMVDANHMLDVRRASYLARLLEPYNISWFEEPVHNNEPADLLALRERTSIPIAAGQIEAFRWFQRNMIATGAVDIAQTDVVNVGGFTEGLKVAHLAQAYHLPLATHGWPRLNMHLVAGVANGWRVEFHATLEPVEEAIFESVALPEDGTVKLPAEPGLGLTVREDVLKETETV